jgi:hypothetical protein
MHLKSLNEAASPGPKLIGDQPDQHRLDELTCPGNENAMVVLGLKGLLEMEERKESLFGVCTTSSE